ncbi:MAG: Stk1 family PASTA domain-containing Ser/Thr kinase [Clostridiaceae bacterium]|nr:Stk1 family PASTA domain-containing Ser/Thr kinase [Clostridiaceae bacterium]
MTGRVLGDRYEVIEKVGGGGMALVYKAKCRLLNRFVAIKVLRPEFTEDEEFVKKFRREAQSAASLSHPNIVGIYDVGTQDTNYYIVMEYIKGQTLKELIKSKGTLGVEYATNIAIQICYALDHAHKNNIVHRDIKSHNILIREDNSVKVTDFGIARAVSSSTITNTGNVIGSVHYFSPEQARGGYTDAKSDIYSLGVVMYEMLTGRLPFEGESPIAVALKHIQEEPEAPSKINPRIPKAIEAIILKCMEKEVSKRYNSAAEIINDLRQSLVMPNGDFVKKNKYTDENTRVIEPIRIIDMEEESENVEEPGSKVTNEGKEEKIIIDDYTVEPVLKLAEGSEKPIQKKRNMKFIVAAIFGGLLLALLLGGGILFVNSLFTVKEVAVPDILNNSEEEAREKLIPLSLILEVTERVFNKDIPEGSIISQNPKPNEKNKVTNPVKVVVSKGPRKVVVPSLVGESYDKVKLILEGEGLIEGTFDQEYSEYPNGFVIRQSINSGISVDEGTVIDYVISIGPEKFIMPSYIGANIEDVKTDLIIRDLILGNVSYDSSSEHPTDTVLEQSIKTGTEVSRKSVVDFVVNNYKPEPVPTSFKLHFTLPPELESMKVTVYKVQNEISSRIYESIHKSTDSPLDIPVSGEGNVIFEVYINDSLHKSVTHSF